MKYLFTYLVLVVASHSSAQVIKADIFESSNFLKHKLTWALREKNEFEAEDNIIQVENTGNNMFQLAYTARLNAQKHALIIHKFDAQHKEIATNKLENGDREFGPIPSLSLEFSNHILLIYFRYSDKDSMKLYVSEIDKDNLSLKNTVHLYSYSQRNMGLMGMMTSFPPEIITRISPDSGKLLIAYSTSKNELFSCVLNDKLILLKKKTSKNIIPAGTEITNAFLENSGSSEIVFTQKNAAFGFATVHGILVQRLDNQERYLTYNMIGGNSTPENLNFKYSASNSKLYVFGDYAAEAQMNGVWIAELESQNYKISKPLVFPYPEEFKKRIYQTGFGRRKRDDYSVYGVNYELVEYVNGDIALCGHPEKKLEGEKYISYFAGPVIVSFIDKNRKQSVFSMIPRNHHLMAGSKGVYVPYQDKMIVFYNDYEKNFKGELTDESVDRIRVNAVKEVSFGYAVIKKDGTVEERKLLTEGISRFVFFNTSRALWISDKRLQVPSSSEEKKKDVIKVADITIE